MKRKNLLFTLFFLLQTCATSFGATVNVPSERPAIVLAAFGTTHVAALPGIMNILAPIRQAFPGVEVRLSFTSNIVRRAWRERRHDQAFLASHPEVPNEVLAVKGPLATIADLQDEGYGHIIVQPTHIAFAEEYADLSSYVDAFNSIKTIKKRNMPLQKVALGRPVLGVPGIIHEYRKDLERAARAVAEDTAKAKEREAALVYMGHGNDHFSTGVYAEFAEVMGKIYPETKTYLTMVEGFPSNDILFRDLARDKVKKVYLKTFMTVAGVHTQEDMAGDTDDSLKNQLIALGIEVDVDLQGLGENKAFAAIFVENIKDAAADNGIDL